MQPSSAGRQVPLSTVQKLAKNREISTALLLDHDNRVEIKTTTATPVLLADGTLPPTPAAPPERKPRKAPPAPTGPPPPSVNNAHTPAKKEAAAEALPVAQQALWASYPASGAQTQQLTNELVGERRDAWRVDQQAWQGDAHDRRAVPDPDPAAGVPVLAVHAPRRRRRARRDRGASRSSRGKGRKQGQGHRDRITFADVAGAGEAVAELREIRDYLADPSKYLAVGAAAPKGVLLVGPPGTGKTLLAKAVAGEADAAFFSLSGSDFVESLVGVGAARVRDLFRKARKASPAIIFIDELDAAGRKRGAGIGQGNDEREQTLNQILVEMDGFAGDGGLVVMGATNRPDILDPALLRPGRFDRQVVIDTPDVHGRLEILRLHGGKRPLAPDASLEEVARQTPGLQRRGARQRDQRGGAAERPRRARADRPGDARGGDRPRRRGSRQAPHPHRTGALADRDPRGLPRRRHRGARSHRPPRASSRSSPAGASSGRPRTCSPTATS